MTVGNFIGFCDVVEAIVDKSEVIKTGEFTSSGNLELVLKESLIIAKINAYKYLT